MLVHFYESFRDSFCAHLTHRLDLLFRQDVNSVSLQQVVRCTHDVFSEGKSEW